MSKWQTPPDPRTSFRGMTAYEREKQAMTPYRKDGSSSNTSSRVEGRTEFDVLKENLRFIREDENPESVTYEERLARAYESKLFKEYALIDLKHYKTRQIALRWRTADEVITSIGETTCASLRCPYHHPSPDQLSTMSEQGISMPQLQAFELPFAYTEDGQKKQALVKVRVCERCARKITYKSEQGKKHHRRKSSSSQDEADNGSSEKRRLKSTQKRRKRSESPRRR